MIPESFDNTIKIVEKKSNRNFFMNSKGHIKNCTLHLVTNGIAKKYYFRL